MTRDDLAITPEQCRAARSLLNWSQPELAAMAGIGQSTVANFERGFSTPYPDTLKTIRATLESAGIIFIDRDSTAGPGVRLRK